MPRLLLLIPSTSYRVSDFVSSAHRLGIDVTVGSNEAQVLESISNGGTISIDFKETKLAISTIEKFNKKYPVNAIVAVDDMTGIIAAKASKRLGLLHNSPETIRLTGNKLLLRQKLYQNDLPSPTFQKIKLHDNPRALSSKLNYPCVLKPLNLSASQGVIRANNTQEFIVAFKKIKKILLNLKMKYETKILPEILIEEYIEGEEVALEGVMINGKLTTLGIFDKPDPLEGPYFEETIYVTPSRKSEETQYLIKNMAEQAANAIGLKEGPVHIELRIPPKKESTNDKGPCVIEIAARSIGGLCSRSLEFVDGLTLEDIILNHALGKPILPEREKLSSGVMMIPIPKAGVLERVDGILEAQATKGVKDLTITIPIGSNVLPLPEGNKYLGFIFAKDKTPQLVEHILREAFSRLRFIIN